MAIWDGKWADELGDNRKTEVRQLTCQAAISLALLSCPKVTCLWQHPVASSPQSKPWTVSVLLRTPPCCSQLGMGGERASVSECSGPSLGHSTSAYGKVRPGWVRTGGWSLGDLALVFSGTLWPVGIPSPLTPNSEGVRRHLKAPLIWVYYCSSCILLNLFLFGP